MLALVPRPDREPDRRQTPRAVSLRLFVTCLLLAAIIVGPLTYVLERSLANEAAIRALKKEEMARCVEFNDLRAAQIAMVEASQKAVAEVPSSAFTPKDRLLWTLAVQRGNRAIEAATKPKAC